MQKYGQIVLIYTPCKVWLGVMEKLNECFYFHNKFILEVLPHIGVIILELFINPAKLMPSVEFNFVKEVVILGFNSIM